MMNRDDSRLIKIPDANPMAAGTGEGGGVGPPNAGQQNSAPVFPQRPSVIEVPQMPVGSNLGGSGSGGPLQAHRTGVTAYRGEPAGVGPPALPPAAHTGVILTTSASPGAAPQPPSVVMHGPQSTVMSQLPSTVKPEPISKDILRYKNEQYTVHCRVFITSLDFAFQDCPNFDVTHGMVNSGQTLSSVPPVIWSQEKLCD
jgi:hypothetical protein